jgi:hypothetical protein
MSLMQIARDDEDIRCVSPQRIVPASSPSRVLPFPSPATLSDADRLRLLDEHDPESATMIRAVLYRLSQRYG